MKIYGLYSVHCNYCDSWDNLVQLYRIKDDADFACLVLQDSPHDEETDSWYVIELDVI